jgi:hypothetical protein
MQPGAHMGSSFVTISLGAFCAALLVALALLAQRFHTAVRKPQALVAGLPHAVNNRLAYVMTNLGYAQAEIRHLAQELPVAAPTLAEIEQALAEALHGAEQVSSTINGLAP